MKQLEVPETLRTNEGSIAVQNFGSKSLSKQVGRKY